MDAVDKQPGRLEASLSALAVLAASMILAVSIFVVAQRLAPNGGEPAQVARAVATLVAAWGVVRLVLVRWRRYAPAQLGLRVDRGTATQFAIALGLGVVSALAAYGAALLAHGYEVHVASPHEFPHAHVVLVGFVATVAGAAFEEVAFRAGLVGAMCGALPTPVAVFVPALPFALAHASNPGASVPGLANVLLAGVVLGLFYLDPVGRPRTPLLGLCTGWHAGWNFTVERLGIRVSGVAPRGRWLEVQPGAALWSGGAFGIEASLAATFVLLALVAVLVARRRARHGSAS